MIMAESGWVRSVASMITTTMPNFPLDVGSERKSATPEDASSPSPRTSRVGSNLQNEDWSDSDNSVEGSLLDTEKVERFYSTENISNDSKLEKYSRKIKDRINELLHSEVVYVEKLKRMEQYYLSLKKVKGSQEALVLSQEEIFPKVLELRRFHSKLLVAINKAQNNLTTLANVFIRSNKSFAMYLNYNTLYQKLLHKDFLDLDKSPENHQRYDIQSYFTEPSKRLPSYLVLFTEILKICKRSEDRMKKKFNASDSGRNNYLLEGSISKAVQSAIDVIKTAQENSISEKTTGHAEDYPPF